MKLNVFDVNGKKKSTIEVSDEIFGAEYNEALIHQLVVAQLANNAAKNREVVDYLYDLLRPDMSAAQVEQILTAAADATAKIEKAYRHVERFDLKPAETAPIEGSISPSSATEQQPTKHIRGSLKRSN